MCLTETPATQKPPQIELGGFASATLRGDYQPETQGCAPLLDCDADSVDPNPEQSGLPRPRTSGMGAASAVNLGSTETSALSQKFLG